MLPCRKPRIIWRASPSENLRNPPETFGNPVRKPRGYFSLGLFGDIAGLTKIDMPISRRFCDRGFRVFLFEWRRSPP